ncbi:MAG: GatB/YqeY domain-containing protein [Candidatus Omnitrophica bacterium]|nr:GatB/YqeY domain-containing protein [Candidatus Omnitrophota bacterium]
MPTLTERLETDYKTALKAQDRLRVDTLRLIKAAMQRVAIEKRKDTLEDQEIIQILGQQAKQRRETLEAAKQGGRQDVAEQATAELGLITAYLPQQLSADALKQLVEEAVKTVGANQGQIMKFVMGKAAGAADGKLVSQLVGERLKQGSPT